MTVSPFNHAEVGNRSSTARSSFFLSGERYWNDALGRQFGAIKSTLTL